MLMWIYDSTEVPQINKKYLHHSIVYSSNMFFISGDTSTLEVNVISIYPVVRISNQYLSLI